MNPYRSGKLVLFQVTYDRDWHFFEIIFFVILGIFGVTLISCSASLLAHNLLGSIWCLHGQIQHAIRGIP